MKLLDNITISPNQRQSVFVVNLGWEYGDADFLIEDYVIIPKDLESSENIATEVIQLAKFILTNGLEGSESHPLYDKYVFSYDKEPEVRFTTLDPFTGFEELTYVSMNPSKVMEYTPKLDYVEVSYYDSDRVEFEVNIDNI